jgi:O-antigen ligase
MSTYELSSESRPPEGAGIAARALRVTRSLAAADVLGIAVLVLLLYAAFGHGAVQAVATPRSPDEPRLQVAVAAVAALGFGVWIWGGSLRIAAPRLTLVGIALLAAFAVWSGVSLAWSVSPDGTWLELNRYLTYTVVLVLAVIVGASARRGTELILHGFLVVVGLVTLDALGQKLVPELHIGGLINLNQTGLIPRLQQPFGYWNALALFVVMGVPMALAVCGDRTRSPRLRLAALGSLELMFLAIGFTYSRGGLVALVVAVAVALAVGGGRLRGLLWLALAAVASVVPLALGLHSHVLTTAGVSLSQRSGTGAELSVAVVATLAVLVLAGRRVTVLEPDVQISPARARAIARGLLALLAALVLVGLIALALSHRGLTGTFSHAWHSFTASRGANDTNPNNLLSADSGNRWVWWKEALGAFSARPLGGWGAGSFPVTHLLFRRNDLGVLQPHSVPLQYLAETGLIGALLAIGAFLTLIASGLRTARLLAPGRDRLIAAALLGAAVAYGVHACYDWDSDIPGVTLPVLVFLGALAGSAGKATAARRASRLQSMAHLPTALPARGRGSLSPGLRMAAIVLTTVAMCAFALSVVLPSLAAEKASSAELAVGPGTPAALRQADKEAVLATRLDPLSDAGLLAEATVASRRQQIAAARALDIRALARDPSDTNAWEALAFVEVLGNRLGAGIQAAQRILELDPKGPASVSYAVGVAQAATVQEALPEDAPTDIPTPPPATTDTADTGTAGTGTTPADATVTPGTATAPADATP